MNKIKRILSDAMGLLTVCGPYLALKWLFEIALHMRSVLTRRNLQPADRAMGDGPFAVKLKKYNVKFRIKGRGAFSGIREMYVRDTYLRDGTLAIRNGDCVVDLGANMGNFTNLALAHGTDVRVVAVEPGKVLNSAFNASVGMNAGYLERVKLVNAFVGLMADKQQSVMTTEEYAGARWISEDELIELARIDKVDFLKCDIEGGEFGLLTPDSKLLTMAKSLAIEIHHFAGEVEQFLEMLKACGFSVLSIQRDPDGTATVLAKRVATP